MKTSALLMMGVVLASCSYQQETRTTGYGYQQSSSTSFGVPPAPPVGYVYTPSPTILGAPPADAIGYYNDPYYGMTWVGWRPSMGYVYSGGPRLNVVLVGRPVPHGFDGRRFYHYQPPPPPRYRHR